MPVLGRAGSRRQATNRPARSGSGTALRFRIPCGVVGQALRNGRVQVALARFLRMDEGEVIPLAEQLPRARGELCGATNPADIIDASVVILAKARGDYIVTSDPRDLRRLDPTCP